MQIVQLLHLLRRQHLVLWRGVGQQGRFAGLPWRACRRQHRGPRMMGGRRCLSASGSRTSDIAVQRGREAYGPHKAGRALRQRALQLHMCANKDWRCPPQPQPLRAASLVPSRAAPHMLCRHEEDRQVGELSQPAAAVPVVAHQKVEEPAGRGWNRAWPNCSALVRLCALARRLRQRADEQPQSLSPPWPCGWLCGVQRAHPAFFANGAERLGLLRLPSPRSHARTVGQAHCSD